MEKRRLMFFLLAIGICWNNVANAQSLLYHIIHAAPEQAACCLLLQCLHVSLLIEIWAAQKDSPYSIVCSALTWLPSPAWQSRYLGRFPEASGRTA